jgi:hypothetical protein
VDNGLPATLENLTTLGFVCVQAPSCNTIICDRFISTEIITSLNGYVVGQIP